MKQVIWLEIDAYLRKNKQIINSEIEEIKNLNPPNNVVDNLIFSHIKKRVLTHLAMILLDENCTCLCSNCHSIEGAVIFKKYKKKII